MSAIYIVLSAIAILVIGMVAILPLVIGATALMYGIILNAWFVIGFGIVITFLGAYLVTYTLNYFITKD